MMGKIHLNAGFPVFLHLHLYLYSKDPELVVTFGYRTCQKSVYEGSMERKNQS